MAGAPPYAGRVAMLDYRDSMLLSSPFAQGPHRPPAERLWGAGAFTAFAEASHFLIQDDHCCDVPWFGSYGTGVTVTQPLQATACPAP